MEHPVIFISYSHDNEEHEKWVLKLASDLRSHGVDAILDQWELKAGMDLRLFMEQGLSNSAWVLCVCSENYVQKFNSGKCGVGYEGSIMTQSLLQNANSDYIISIIRNNNTETKVPLALGSKIYIDFTDDSRYYIRYRELLERIYGEDKKKKPPLGESPFSSGLALNIEDAKQIQSVQYHSPSMDNTVNFHFDNNNGNYQIGNGEYLFTTRWSRSGNNSIYAYGKVGFQPDIKEIPDISSVKKFDFSSDVRTVHTGQVIILQNDFNHFAAIKMGEVRSSNHGFDCDEMNFTYHIYSVE